MSSACSVPRVNSSIAPRMAACMFSREPLASCATTDWRRSIPNWFSPGYLKLVKFNPGSIFACREQSRVIQNVSKGLYNLDLTQWPQVKGSVTHVISSDDPQWHTWEYHLSVSI